MSEVFNTYSRRPTIYYIFNVVMLLPFILLFIGWKVDLKASSKYYPYFIALFVSALVATVIGMILPATKLVRMYIIDGELILSSEAITIKSQVIALKTVRKIEIRASDYKGARTSDGSGNRIEVANSDSEIVRCRFVIKSKEQKDKLDSILKQWESNGVNIYR